MKVVAINGSPKSDGNTAAALKQVGLQLEKHNIGLEIIHIGHKAIHGCIGCGKCRETKDDSCGIKNDSFNDFVPTIKNADGLIIASPVFYSGMSGTMKCFLDRLFYVSGSNGNYFRHKVGASLAVLRRTGASHTLDGLNHYLQYAEMVIATSNYWNALHGATPGQVLEDAEGVQITTCLADNMAWLMTMIENTRNTIPAPSAKNKIWTNFIR